jgi:hypothetical protein
MKKQKEITTIQYKISSTFNLLLNPLGSLLYNQVSIHKKRNRIKTKLLLEINRNFIYRQRKTSLKEII